LKIKVNGEEKKVTPGITVMELLEKLKVDHMSVVVELNLEIPKREKWASLTLADGDSVELIRLVSGG
jgi:sulfur carrier protein